MFSVHNQTGSVWRVVQSVVDILVVRHVTDYLRESLLQQNLIIWRRLVHLVSISKSLAVVIGNLKSKLVLHCNDDLHMVQAVQSQVFDEVGLSCQLVIVYLVKEIEDQHHPDGEKQWGVKGVEVTHLC